VQDHKRSLSVFVLLLIFLNGSIILAHVMGTVTWNRWVLLWLIAGMSDVMAALVAFANSWSYRRRNPFIYYYCMFLGSVVIETVCALIANIEHPIIKDYGTWYTCWFWSGRWARNFAVWMLVLFQVGYFNGVKKKVQEERF